MHERLALERYLERLETAAAEEEPVIDSSAVASALEKLRQHREPEVSFMHVAGMGVKGIRLSLSSTQSKQKSWGTQYKRAPISA